MILDDSISRRSLVGWMFWCWMVGKRLDFFQMTTLPGWYNERSGNWQCLGKGPLVSGLGLRFGMGLAWKGRSIWRECMDD